MKNNVNFLIAKILIKKTIPKKYKSTLGHNYIPLLIVLVTTKNFIFCKNGITNHVFN